MISNVVRRTEEDRYNDQLDVIEANAVLESSGRFPSFLQEVEALIRVSGLIGIVGVRLLHKHNSISSAQRMVESERTRVTASGERIPVLETELVLRRDDQVPIIFSITPTGEPQSLEFSSSVGDSYAALNLSEHKDFLARFAQIVSSYSLGEVVGLCLTNRSFLERHLANEDCILVERTDHQRHSNVVYVENRKNISLDRMIQTSWTFLESGIGCGSVCERKSDRLHEVVDHHPTGD